MYISNILYSKPFVLMTSYININKYLFYLFILVNLESFIISFYIINSIKQLHIKVVVKCNVLKHY